jgi:hypothetical protein
VVTFLARGAVGLVWPHDGEEARRRPVTGRLLVAANEALADGGVAEPSLAIGAEGGGEQVGVEHVMSVRPGRMSPHRATCVFVGLRITRYVASVTPDLAASLDLWLGSPNL